MIFYTPKQLRKACALIFLLALTRGFAWAQLPPPDVIGTAQPLPDNTQAEPINYSQYGNNQSQNNNNDESQNNNNNSNDNGNNPNNPNGTNGQNPNVGPPQPPGIPNAQTPTNPTSVNAPLIPQVSNSPYAPLLPTAQGQSQQYSTPLLYNTGQFDLSQAATSNALNVALGGQTAGYIAQPGGGYSNPPIERIRIGPFDLKAAMATTVIRDDNINPGTGIQDDDRRSDFVFGYTPALLLIYGDHDGQRGYASLVYSPTLTRYYHHSDENSDNQNVAFAASYPFQRITLDVSDTFFQVTGFNQDVGGRTSETSNNAHLGINYGVDDRISVYTSFDQIDTSFKNGGGYGDSISSVSSTAAYKLSDKLSFGPEVKFGIERPDNSPQQTFEDGLITMNYQVTDKISLSGSGGVELRQGGSSSDSTFGSNNSGSGDSISPVFSGGLIYKPADSSQLSLFGYESIQSSSGNVNENVTNTGFGASISQRVLHRFYFGFTYYYSHSSYSSNNTTTLATPTGMLNTTTGVVGSTQDNYIYRPSFSFSPTQWSSVAFYYQFLNSQGSGGSIGYHDKQFGGSLSFQF